MVLQCEHLLPTRFKYDFPFNVSILIESRSHRTWEQPLVPNRSILTKISIHTSSHLYTFAPCPPKPFLCMCLSKYPLEIGIEI